MKHIILCGGESGTGKSVSLRNLPQEKVYYMGTEGDKEIPFSNNIKKKTITDPIQIPILIQKLEGSPYDIGVIDTLTFAMDMYETLYVIGSSNGLKAWGDYNQYFKTLIQDVCAKSTKTIIFLAHTVRNYDSVGNCFAQVPIKGALKNSSIEAYFNNVVSTKVMKISDLEKYQNPLLNITEEEQELGIKHVFQTRKTKETPNERMRFPLGLFPKEYTFIDNDMNVLLEYLDTYYTTTKDKT
jgi:hypothetical protein